MYMPRSGPKTEPTLSQFILNKGEFLKIQVLAKEKLKFEKNQKNQNPEILENS